MPPTERFDPPAPVLQPAVTIPAHGLARITSAQYLLEGKGWTWLRLVLDLVMGGLAVVSAYAGAPAAQVPVPSSPSLFALPLVVALCLHLRGMYARKVRVVVLDGIAPIVGAISVAAMAIAAFEMFLHPTEAHGPMIARAWVFTVLFVGAGRIALAYSQRQARARGWVAKPTLIVGAGVVGTQVSRRLRKHPEYGLAPVGFVDADPPPSSEAAGRDLPVLGGPADIGQIVRETGAEHVILSFSSAPDRGLIPIIRQCEELGLEVSLVPRLFESINDRMALDRLGGLPLLGLRSVDPKSWQFAIKYTLDRIAGVGALVVLGPLLLALALAVRISSPGPVMFRQRRVGRDGQTFDLLKFRSMRPLRPEEEGFRPDAGSAPGGVEGIDRRTRTGKLLRRTSLDELPQLINVARGEMSLIGPRPERPEFVELFAKDIDRYSDRHRVKSGITGWAQVHGLRGQTSLTDRVEWDNFYIENWSLWLDVKVLLLTVVAVFRAAE